MCHFCLRCNFSVQSLLRLEELVRHGQVAVLGTSTSTAQKLAYLFKLLGQFESFNVFPILLRSRATATSFFTVDRHSRLHSPQARANVGAAFVNLANLSVHPFVFLKEPCRDCCLYVCNDN
jgi:hypothetical protein